MKTLKKFEIEIILSILGAFCTTLFVYATIFVLTHQHTFQNFFKI